ncbi:MAG: DUF4136 domain-containing protein [Pseudomonadales bacterium]|nr:DUF4136 domain-containing protein [Pseudomonadales bacterium]
MSRSWILLAAILVAGCESIQTRTDHDPAVDLSSYRTFAWVTDDPRQATPLGVTPLAGERIQRAILATLTSKGYALTDRESADFLVGFTVGARDQIRVQTTNVPVGVGIAGPYWGRAYYQDIDVRNYTEGRLAIDLYDSKLKRPIWHGYATKSLTGRDQGNPERLINSAVTAILQGLQPRSAP